MDSELLDIQPRELKFLFELKKQSTCTIRLVNKFNDYIAFKVKTTSPKKYCVRPNVGILKPKSFCDFIVTMQAPKREPPDMICKDKFLVQSTVVPADTTDDDITSKMFVKDEGKYIEEIKLRVVLLSPPNSPILSPINAMLKKDPLDGASTLIDNEMLKRGSFTQNSMESENVVETKVSDTEVVYPMNNGNFKIVDNLQDEEDSTNNRDYRTLSHVKDEEDPSNNRIDHLTDEENPKKHYLILNRVKDEVKPRKDVEYESLETMKHLEQSSKEDSHNNIMKDVYETKLEKDVQEMKSRLSILESKLTEADITISKLTEEKRWTGQEKENLRQELVLFRGKRGDRKVNVGFPLLFVFMVALVGVMLGYTLSC